jgi:alkylhydroperoxidase/carboxymuconolactone decarboxylase family protein YurZ
MVGAALFADLTDDEREELLALLAWYRTRRRSGRAANRVG